MENFGEHMLRCGVPKHLWCSALMPLLDERSLAYFQSYTEEVKSDFDALRLNLAKSHGLTTAFY